MEFIIGSKYFRNSIQSLNLSLTINKNHSWIETKVARSWKVYFMSKHFPQCYTLGWDVKEQGLPREGTKSILSSEIKPPLNNTCALWLYRVKCWWSATKFEKKNPKLIWLPVWEIFQILWHIYYIRIYQLKNTISKTDLTHFVQSHCWAAHSVGEILAWAVARYKNFLWSTTNK